MAKLCDVCSGIDFASIFGPSKRTPEPDFWEEPEETPHQPSLRALRAAALLGCPLCRLFWEYCEKPFNVGELDPISPGDSEGTIELKTEAQKELENLANTCSILPERLRGLHADCGLPDGAVRSIAYIVGQHRAYFRITPKEGPDIPLAIRNIEDCTDIKLSREWLTDCSTRHTQCPRITESPLTSHVIDVGTSSDAPDIRLIESGGRTGKYATLSHCWGSAKPPMTTKANVSAYRASLSNSSIPKTFRDAMDIVRGLGYRYLWIDCYCIIQDDDVDRERELASMGDIYARSAFTLTAPQAADCQAGIPRGLHPFPVDAFCDIPVTQNGEARNGAIRVSYPDEKPENYAFGFKESLIGKRAWIFQERLLSPRILYFGDDRLQFECMTGQSIEHVQYALKSQRSPFGTASNSVLIWHPPKQALNFRDRYEGLESWYEMVHAYSTLNLTYGTDRIPALMGVASIVSRKLGDELICGLWKSDIAFGLNFMLSVDEPLRSADSSFLRGPTWAWYSWERQVGHYSRQRNRTQVDSFRETGDLRLINNEAAFAPLIDVCSISETSSEEQPNGLTRHGRLNLRGRPLRVILVGRAVYRWKNGKVLGELMPDYSVDSDCAGYITMLPLSISGDWTATAKTAKMSWSACRAWHALALIAATGSLNTFRRVGLIQSPVDLGEKGVLDKSKKYVARWLMSGELREIQLI